MAIVDFNTCIWKDPWFRRLSLKAKNLFVFLWTNDHKNLPCLYQMDMETMAFYTGLSIRDVKDTLSILYPKVKYDFEKEIVWVVNFVRHQFLRTPNLSPKIKKGIENNLLQMNGHFFIKEFIDEYQIFTLPDTYTIDRVSEGYTYPPGEGKGEGKGEGIFYITKKQRKLSKLQYEMFEQFWEVFDDPRGKRDAADSWLDLKITEDLLTRIIAGAERYKIRRPEILLRKGTPKMAQGWLSSRRWEDEHIVNPLDGILSENGQATVRTLQLWNEEKDREEAEDAKQG